MLGNEYSKKLSQCLQDRINCTNFIGKKTNGKLCLNSFVAHTRSHCLKNILLINTVPPIMGIIIDDTQKTSAIYKLYDFTKEGTDVIDQRINFYSVNTKWRRWPVNTFSQTVYSLNSGKHPRNLNSFTYGWDLVQMFCIPQIKLR